MVERMESISINEILLFNMRRGIKGQVFQQDKPGLELQQRLREAPPAVRPPMREGVMEPQQSREVPDVSHLSSQ